MFKLDNFSIWSTDLHTPGAWTAGGQIAFPVTLDTSCARRVQSKQGTPVNRSDIKVLALILLVAVILAVIPEAGTVFSSYNQSHPYMMSFLKFAVLAPLGECLALRIVSGVYWKQGEGLIPKAVVWGFLGMSIKAAFVIFATGVPNALASLGISFSETTLLDGTLEERLLLAFGISVFMNGIFSPILMTIHKITDGHIQDCGGKLGSLAVPIDMVKQFKAIDWSVMWNFVFKKTIPLFWIPAHTITFMLPSTFRVLFAAFLGIALGVILAFAKHKAKPA